MALPSVIDPLYVRSDTEKGDSAKLGQDKLYVVCIFTGCRHVEVPERGEACLKEAYFITVWVGLPLFQCQEVVICR